MYYLMSADMCYTHSPFHFRVEDDFMYIIYIYILY